MAEKPPRLQIRLALTERQKRQIREATGREVNTLELRLEPLSPPTEAADVPGAPSRSSVSREHGNPRSKQ